MDINVGDDEVSQMDFGLKDATFQKLKDLKNHQNPLYIKGHLDGTLISRMLINERAMKVA
jgi:hypothetical protein